MDNSNLLQQLLLIGVGTTALITEKVRGMTDQWVQEGRLNPDQAKAMIDEIVNHLKADASGIEGGLQRQFQQFLEELGVPQQTEMDELRGRIDRLERRLRDLENRLWQ